MRSKCTLPESTLEGIVICRHIIFMKDCRNRRKDVYNLVLFLYVFDDVIAIPRGDRVLNVTSPLCFLEQITRRLLSMRPTMANHVGHLLRAEQVT